MSHSLLLKHLYYNSLILWRRRGCIYVAWEWEKKNHPEQGLCSTAVTSLWGKFLRLIPGHAFPRLPHTWHSQGELRSHPPLSTSQLWGSVTKPPLSTSQLWGNVTKPALSPAHLAKVSRDATGQGQNLSEVPAQHYQAQQPFHLWLQKSCTCETQATTWSCTAIFKLNHSRLGGKKLVTRLLSPPLSSCCPVRQSELISRLAPCLLFS